MRTLNELDGVLLVDKAPGMTSHDVVARIRRKLSIKKVGHCGTLDPLATGLLILRPRPRHEDSGSSDERR